MGPGGRLAGYRKRLVHISMDTLHFPGNVTAARSVLVGISHGTRPGAVKCMKYRAGTGRVPTGPLRARVYIWGHVPIKFVFY